MSKIRKGDEVIVIAGKDKGRRGTVLHVFPDARLEVEGINIARKHRKANPNMGIEGGIVDKTMPIDVSNVMLFNPKTKKGDRVGYSTAKDGSKVRVFKSNSEVVDI